VAIGRSAAWRKLHALLACLQHEMEEIQPAFVRDMQRRAPEVFALIERRRAGDLPHRHKERLIISRKLKAFRQLPGP